MTKLIHVAAAVIYNPQGQILLAQRPTDKHQGGLWEFPGGKVEADESVLQALKRELDEELGIQISDAKPLIQVPYHYPDKSVLLDVYEVNAFQGEPWGREGQPVRWVDRVKLDAYQFPAANRPILNAVLLPTRLLVTGVASGLELADPDSYLFKLNQAISLGVDGVMLRAKTLADDDFKTLAKVYQKRCKAEAVFLTLNCTVDQANALNADAVHLSSERLMALESRGLFKGRWISASCHTKEELARAQRLGLDFVTLSPVLPTRSHPEATPLGWTAFTERVKAVALPVYGLGGLTESDLEKARTTGAQGIAAISAWWG
ncbi:MAG: Nudix family hydrolase [Pontibacterium sp.]